MHKHLVKLEDLGRSEKSLLKHHLTVIDCLVEDQDELALAIYGSKLSKEYWDYRLKAAKNLELEKEGIQTDRVAVVEVLQKLTVMFLCTQYIERTKLYEMIPSFK